MLINNATFQRETLSKRPIRQPLRKTSDDKLISLYNQYQLISIQIKQGKLEEIVNYFI